MGVFYVWQQEVLDVAASSIGIDYRVDLGKL